MTEYLRAARIKPAIKLATALLLGIKNDTSNFEQQTLVEDVRSFQYLFRHANKHLVRKIEQSEIRPDYLKFFKKALENRRVRKGKVFAFLGTGAQPRYLCAHCGFLFENQHHQMEYCWRISPEKTGHHFQK